MRRSTIILLILFVLLGVLVWYMQQPGNPIKTALATSTSIAATTSDVLVSADKGPLTSISIQDTTGKTVVIEKNDGQWNVKTDQVEPADQSQAESAAGHALNLTIIKKLDTAPDPAGTGLDKPAYLFSLVLADGSTFSFDVGKPTVTNNGYYVKTTDGTVYILSKSELDSLIGYFSAPPTPATAAPPAAETGTQVPAGVTPTSAP
jgi:Domain of unknown function (DUF4340)